MKAVRSVLGAVLVVVAQLFSAPAIARAVDFESLMVPSAAMGRDIPVAFSGGGAHAVYLLDAFDAGETVSNWVTVGNAFNSLGGRGIAVVAPAGGAYSMYTDWDQDRSRQWETFLTEELPNWLSANKGLAPGGHGAVGVSQGGTAAMNLAIDRPDRFRYAGSMSGFLSPANTWVNGAITEGMMRFGGVDTRNMWGMPQGGRWKDHDPNSHLGVLADNNTRIWVFCPKTLTASDPAAMIGYADQARGTNADFFSQYAGVKGGNGHFDFPPGGDHGWSSWGPELAKMSADLVTNIR